MLFTGVSPINTPWMGLKRIVQPRREKWSSYAAEAADKEMGIVEY